MNVNPTPEVLNRWGIYEQSCTDTPLIHGMEHARYLLDHHTDHRCQQFWAALGHSSVVIG